MPERSGSQVGSRPSSLRDLIREGSFGSFYCNGFEFLRRIFVTVRDQNWGEIAPSHWHYSVDEAASVINVSARHTSEEVDFEWTGRLEVGAAGCELSFEFEGRALKTMEINRLGLVILHPVTLLTGATLTTREGTRVATSVVRPEIAPQSLINGVPGAMTEPFTSLRIEHARWGQLELDLEGDQFELEDQRNWGDDSFKTYCTPLRLGFPRTVEKGRRIVHRLQARFVPSPGVRDRAARAEIPTETVAVRTLRVGRLAATAQETRVDPNWLLGWDHIRIDLEEAGEDALRTLLAHLSGDTTLHLVVTVDEGSSLSRARVNLLSILAAHTSAILLRDRKRGLPTAHAVAHVREALKRTAAEGVPLLAIPNGYFVEFNRGEPFDLHVDGIAFPLSPTVHGEDAATILENAPVVRAMIETARRLTGKSHISLSPLALSLSRDAKRPDVSRSVVTAWLAEVLMQAQAVGVEAVTLSSDLL